MQFAGGMSVAQVAAAWDRDAEWVEEAIRRALLEYIPRRDGGLKASRSELRKADAGVSVGVAEQQPLFEDVA